ncbi:MAG: InlB B-repeat-containing protein [Clostridiales bacterium]|nr:InlB B-repeat-containing protein [Clostridiales bacterium]
MSEQIPPKEEKNETETAAPRRYGLFGVSTYPKKSGMDDAQRLSMRRWSSAFVAVMAALVLILVFLSSGSSGGLTVTFDTQGGSAAETQSVLYGDTAEEPEDVVRPGYTLAYWSLYPDGSEVWDFSSDVVEEGITLYAIWEEE